MKAGLMTHYMQFPHAHSFPQNPTQTYIPSLCVSLVDASLRDTVLALLSAGRCRVTFLNAHCFNMMARSRRYAHAVHSADLRLPDGLGVAMACKMAGKKLAANLNGTDLVPALLAKAAQQGKSVYLFGGTPGTAQKAAKALISNIPDLQIVGLRDGYQQAENEEKVIADINKSGADIVLVAMGVPLQDIWLHCNAHRIDADLTMGVGAALDFLAGNVIRAPNAMRIVGGEWIWRLAFEPRRLAKRYLVGNVTFLARAARLAMHQLKISRVARRSLDVVVSGTAALLLAPIFAATALAIKAQSRGPVFFRQVRVGKDGVPFEMFKFRSMREDAEECRRAVLATSDRDGICFKSKSDPRITSVGQFIRRFSIDELPQIFNVLRGEMSVVGPRPALQSEVTAYPNRALKRLAVKPGMTGIWQVSGRADVGFDKMIDMDLAYVKSRSILLDLILISMTFRAVLTGRGAH